MLCPQCLRIDRFSMGYETDKAPNRQSKYIRTLIEINKLVIQVDIKLTFANNKLKEYYHAPSLFENLLQMTYLLRNGILEIT